MIFLSKYYEARCFTSLTSSRFTNEFKNHLVSMESNSPNMKLFVTSIPQINVAEISSII